VHEWKLRTDPGYLREEVFRRDKGVCALCGVDCVAEYNHARRHPRALAKWGLKPRRRKSLWDADHIVPVVEGGGECDLDNLRTLCLRCHRQVTSDLRERLATVEANAGNDLP
jgi:5-methylcytosine-specific restriction enzyme A